MIWLLWFGLVFTIWRVTRLLVKDEFPPIKRPREWVLRTFWRPELNVDNPKRPDDVTRWLWFWRQVGHSLAYLATCPWCMSFWVGLAVWGIAVRVGFSVPLPWVLIAVASGVSGLIAMVETRVDQAFEESERRLGR